MVTATRSPKPGADVVDVANAASALPQARTQAPSQALSLDPPPRPTSVRATRQGDALAAALASSTEFRSAQDLHAQLRTEGQRIGLTTVYRHLQVLAERGEVDVLRGDDGETSYRRCVTRVHHHHLVCRVCGRTVEVADSGVEAWTERVAAAAGFSDVQHTVEISGTCADCAAAERIPTAAQAARPDTHDDRTRDGSAHLGSGGPSGGQT